MPHEKQIFCVVARNCKTDINLVENCPTCVREAKHRREPLLCTDLPDYPWQVVGSDLFVLKETQYLLVVDYFSRFYH